MNTIKIVAFAIGFAVLFAAMFWLGSLAPGEEKKNKSETGKGK